MALTSTVKPITNTPFMITESSLSTLVAGKSEAISHNGPSGATPLLVLHTTTTRPTDGSVVDFSWTGTSTSGNTVSVTLDTVPGGSLTGAAVKVYCIFIEQASGGTTYPSYAVQGAP